MRYPATVCWFDSDHESWQNYTVCETVLGPEEVDAALDRFDRDMQRVGFPLMGDIHDIEGHQFTFGFTSRQELGFITFQPSHLLNNDRGHYQFIPLKWSVASSADATSLPPILYDKGQKWVSYRYWNEYDPYNVAIEYCVPIPLVRQAIREYLATGTFSACIAWGERADWTLASP